MSSLLKLAEYMKYALEKDNQVGILPLEGLEQ